MPIYVEARNIQNALGILGGHMYLVYVPEGEANNYDAWQTIGVFPEIPGAFGPWGLIEANRTGKGDSFDGAMRGATDDYLNEISDIDPKTYKPSDAELQAIALERGRKLVYSGPDEATKWTEMSQLAADMDLSYTYKAFTLIGPYYSVWGPTTNSNAFVASIIRTTTSVDPGDILPDPVPNSPVTDDRFPGWRTQFGSTGSDNLTIVGDMEALFGGEGADILNSSPSDTGHKFLVAGKDREIDTLNGGAGSETLVGYYNQSDINSSDRFFGGTGNDTILVVNHEDMLLGGIPNIDAHLDGSDSAFKHDGTLGAGGQIDGGAGYDTLSFEHVNGSVSLRVGTDTMSGI